LLLFILFATALAISVPAQEGKPAENTREKAMREAVDLLDRIELEAPRAHADLVKLREKLQVLYDIPQYADSPGEPEIMYARRTSRNRRIDWTGFYNTLKGLKNDELRQRLQKQISNQRACDYTTARRHVMLEIDNYDHYVECVYTGKVIAVSEMPKTTVMNIEHTWPQSKGATGVAKSDMHHLFPTDPVANSTRSSLPFGMVDRPAWQAGGSECDLKRFEVRKKSRGNTARAIFYFATRYAKTISSSEEEVLRGWHREDPVDANERARNDRVESVQGNRNPFIDRPELVEYISDF
jgi:endonuclease I